METLLVLNLFKWMRNIFYMCDDSNGLHDITLNTLSKCKLYQIQANASDFQCFYYNLFSGLQAQTWVWILISDNYYF